jgi:hypothetical protein
MDFGGWDETEDYQFGSRYVAAVGNHKPFRVH